MLLKEYLKMFNQPWILSYDMCPDILRMYSDNEYSACDVNLIYTPSNYGKREIGRELIVTNFSNKISELQLGSDKHSSSPKKLDARIIEMDNYFDSKLNIEKKRLSGSIKN